jgi:hypothetical protein
MIMLKNNIITDTLMPPDTIGYYVGARLAAEHPKRFVLSMFTYDADVEAYAQAGHCALTLASDVHAEILHSWDGPEAGLKQQVLNAWFDVDWQGQQIAVLQLCWTHGRRIFILADTEDVARRFVAAVSAWSAQGNGSVLVFEDNGDLPLACWCSRTSTRWRRPSCAPPC